MDPLRVIVDCWLIVVTLLTYPCQSLLIGCNTRMHLLIYSLVVDCLDCFEWAVVSVVSGWAVVMRVGLAARRRAKVGFVVGDGGIVVGQQESVDCGSYDYYYVAYCSRAIH